MFIILSPSFCADLITRRAAFSQASEQIPYKSAPVTLHDSGNFFTRFSKLMFADNLNLDYTSKSFNKCGQNHNITKQIRLYQKRKTDMRGTDLLESSVKDNGRVIGELDKTVVTFLHENRNQENKKRN